MGIPNKISPLTGGDILPRGYIAAEFLESTGSQYLMVEEPFDTLKSGTWVYFERRRVTYSTSFLWSVPGKPGSETAGRDYSPCMEGYIVHRYGGGGNAEVSKTVGIYINSYNWLNKGKYYLKRGNVERYGTDSLKNNPEYQINQSKQALFCAYSEYGNQTTYFSLSDRLFSAKFSQNDVVTRRLYPYLNNEGIPCMFDIETRQAFVNQGTGSFIVGMTISQARYLCQLPVTESGALTVSLPWEAQWDIGVQNALSIAATHGWTITVQYRDPEVATKNIPIGFLESTGTQYIQTALMQSDEDVYTLNMDNTTLQNYLFGAREAWNSKNIGLSYEPAYKRWVVGWGSSNNYNYNYVDDKRVLLEYKKGYLTVNGTVSSYPASSGVPIHPLALFAVNQSDSPLLSKGVLIRSFQVISAGAVRLDFIPALDPQGVPCMYDKVTKQSFPNAGTGSFIAGFDTIEQSRNLAHLPGVTAETDTAKKSLTVSLPWEAQLVITGVPAALQVAADRGWTITVQYRDPEADNAYYNKYAKCVTIADMFAVNSQYVADLTAKDEWIYPLSSFKSGKCIFGWAYGDYPNGRPTPIKVFNADAPIATNISGMFMRCLNLEAIKGQFTKVTHTVEMCWGCQKLSTVESEFPALAMAASMFSQCQLNKESILRVLNSIPTYTSGTHILTIGIHTDLQTDEEVTTAIADAEAKGWTLTVQWNGTATAAAASVSTFGLRSPSIYVKLITIEQPDSTTKQVLDWGHYVTNWEENGYQEFSSVEEAEEYFNINQTEEL